MKKITAFIYTLLLTVALIIPGVCTHADSGYLVDNIGLLSDEDASAIGERLDGLKSDYDIDVAIVTTDDLNGKSHEAYADDYSDENFGINADSVVFLRYKNGSDKKVWISTSGVCFQVFYDNYIDHILDEIESDFMYERYGNAFNTFLDEVERGIKQYREDGTIIKNHTTNSGKTDYDDENDVSFSELTTSQKVWTLLRKAVIPFIVGIVIAFIIVSKLKKDLKSVYKASEAKNYEKLGSFKVTDLSEKFLGKSVSRVKIESSSSSSGGSFHSSGHHSSGGGFHGGGGRHM